MGSPVCQCVHGYAFTLLTAGDGTLATPWNSALWSASSSTDFRRATQWETSDRMTFFRVTPGARQDPSHAGCPH